MTTTTQSASKFGALALGAIALGCAGLAAFLVSTMMTSRYAKTKVVPVVVAKVALKVGQTVTAEELVVVDWPQESVPAGAFSTVETVLAAFERVSPTVGILAGEPVVKSRLSNPGQGTGVAALVRPNMRALALEVDASVANTGLVYPGAVVDVIVTFRDQDGTGPTAITAVQRAKVLSVGLDIDVATRRSGEGEEGLASESRDTTYVTLEVTPDEAEVIGIARTEGTIDLALRNGADESVVETTGARPLDIIPQLVYEEPLAELGTSGKRSNDNAGRDEPLTRRVEYAAPRRVKRIRLTAKPETIESGKSSGIETYRAK